MIVEINLNFKMHMNLFTTVSLFLRCSRLVWTLTEDFTQIPSCIKHWRLS